MRDKMLIELRIFVLSKAAAAVKSNIMLLPIVAKVEYAQSLDPDETPINFHPFQICL